MKLFQLLILGGLAVLAEFTSSSHSLTVQVVRCAATVVLVVAFVLPHVHWSMLKQRHALKLPVLVAASMVALLACALNFVLFASLILWPQWSGLTSAAVALQWSLIASACGLALGCIWSIVRDAQQSARALADALHALRTGSAIEPLSMTNPLISAQSAYALQARQKLHRHSLTQRNVDGLHGTSDAKATWQQLEAAGRAKGIRKILPKSSPTQAPSVGHRQLKRRVVLPSDVANVEAHHVTADNEAPAAPVSPRALAQAPSLSTLSPGDSSPAGRRSLRQRTIKPMGAKDLTGDVLRRQSTVGTSPVKPRFIGNSPEATSNPLLRLGTKQQQSKPARVPMFNVPASEGGSDTFVAVDERTPHTGHRFQLRSMPKSERFMHAPLAMPFRGTTTPATGKQDNTTSV